MGLGTATLLQIQTAARYGKMSRLRRHRARLASNKPLTNEELRALERDFLETDVPFSPFVMALPTFAASGLAIATLAEKSDSSPLWAASGVVGIGAMVWYSLGDHAVPHYRSEIRSLGLELDAGLSGPGYFVRGRF